VVVSAEVCGGGGRGAWGFAFWDGRDVGEAGFCSVAGAVADLICLC